MKKQDIKKNPQLPKRTSSRKITPTAKREAQPDASDNDDAVPKKTKTKRKTGTQVRSQPERHEDDDPDYAGSGDNVAKKTNTKEKAKTGVICKLIVTPQDMRGRSEFDSKVDWILGGERDLENYTRLKIPEFKRLVAMCESYLEGIGSTRNSSRHVAVAILVAKLYMIKAMTYEDIAVLLHIRSNIVPILKFGLDTLENTYPAINVPHDRVDWLQMEAGFLYHFGLQGVRQATDWRAPEGGAHLLLAVNANKRILHIEQLDQLCTEGMKNKNPEEADLQRFERSEYIKAVRKSEPMAILCRHEGHECTEGTSLVLQDVTDAQALIGGLRKLREENAGKEFLFMTPINVPTEDGNSKTMSAEKRSINKAIKDLNNMVELRFHAIAQYANILSRHKYQNSKESLYKQAVRVTGQSFNAARGHLLKGDDHECSPDCVDYIYPLNRLATQCPLPILPLPINKDGGRHCELIAFNEQMAKCRGALAEKIVDGTKKYATPVQQTYDERAAAARKHRLETILRIRDEFDGLPAKLKAARQERERETDRQSNSQ